MPTITRERTRAGLRLVEVAGLGAIMVVSRPKHGGQVLAVIDAGTPTPTIRNVGRALFPTGEYRQLAAFLDLRRKR